MSVKTIILSTTALCIALKKVFLRRLSYILLKDQGCRKDKYSSLKELYPKNLVHL